MTREALRRAPRPRTLTGPVRATSRTGWRRLTPYWPQALLALTIYVPLLLTAPGKVGADTKAYLYLDPDKLLARAPYMWDEHIGAGSVTHQNIGYLFPMGPWYWLFEHLHVPTWIAERLWTGTLLFLAGLGVRYLLRTFSWRLASVWVGAAGYALTPYALEYEARTSAILLPYVGLPWMLGLSVRAMRSPRGWRYPALIALVIFTIGGTNATSLVYAALGPLLWFPYAVWVRRDVTLRPALAVLGRTALLTLLVSLWWMAGLSVQSGYGLNVLRYTETVRTVSASNNPLEVLRGLGNWYFYGGDRVSPWVAPSVRYMTNPGLLAASYAVPTLALLSAAFVRWRHRVFFVVLLVLGVVIAVGAHPYADPSPLGRLFRAFAQSSTAGLALRTTPRAAPLVVLSELVLLAAGVQAMLVARAASLGAATPRLAPAGRRLLSRRLAAPAVVTIVLAIMVMAMAPLFTGSVVDPSLQAPASVPGYWQQAIASLEARGPATRVLELPGQDFSYYRWGTTADPITPGLLDRPFVSRELTPYGTPASADLVRALDRRLQEGVFEPAALAPLARLLGVGDIVLRSDLQYERFLTPRPRRTFAQFTEPGAGLGPARGYGPAIAEKPAVPLLDEISLSTARSAADPPPVAVFPVPDAVPIVRSEPAGQPLLIDGDAEGLTDAAAAGLLARRQVVLFAPSLTPAQRQQALATSADLLVTDSNRQRAERWGSLRENYGVTEGPQESALTSDPTDNRLPVFPGDQAADRTTSQLSGFASVRASGYGDPLSYIPADRPANSVDGDPTTAWRVGAFDDVRGERLRIALRAAVTTDHLTLLQPVTGPRNRFLTRVGVRLNGGPERSYTLGDASRTEPGQVIHFPRQQVTQVEIVLHDTNVGLRSEYLGDSGVGFAEVALGGVTGRELVSMPTGTLFAAGTSSAGHRLVLQMSRQRSDPAEPVKQDDELAMEREFTLPTARSFSLSGTARLSTYVGDLQLDRLLGVSGGPAATSSARLPGSVGARASAAFDADTSTAWTTPFGNPAEQSLQVRVARPVTASSLNLSVIADGQHSVPTAVRLLVDGRPRALLTLPALADGSRPGTVGSARLSFPRVSGRTFTFEVAAVRAENTIDFYSRAPHQLPVAIAEVGLAGIRTASPPARLPAVCRSDLLTIDGKPLAIRLTGTTSDAAARRGLGIESCDTRLPLAAGRHVLRAAQGRFSGVDLDRLLLSSGAGPATAGGGSARPAGPAASPAVTVVRHGPVSTALHVSGASPGKPFWLVLGQSLSNGWSATTSGHSLGAPRLVDGYANGWLVTPTTASFDVHLSWTPQRRVWIALALSSAGVLLCLGLVLRRRREAGLGTAREGQHESSDADVSVWAGRSGERGARRASARAVIAAAGGLGALSLAVAGPGAGVAVAALTTLGLVLPRCRPLFRLLPAGAYLLGVVYVLEVQVRYQLPADFNWVRHFDRIQPLAWLGPLLLLSTVVVDRVGTPASDVTPAPQAPSG